MHNSPFNWNGTREALKARLGSEVVGRWLDPISVATVTDTLIVLEAPNTFFRDWVSAHYTETLKSFTGGREVRIVVASASKLGTVLQTDLERVVPTSKKTKAPPPVSGTRPAWSPSLNPKYTFDKFVVGPSNRFAHAASMAVAEAPAKAYNPLFLYGGVGLGKTHLMQAIGHAILAKKANSRVVYLSSEGFTNELITAIQTKNTSKFRDRYRTVDVLLVDDIHFISGKEATQEEFFHTFNALYDAHKQIIISSDRSPKEISGLEERLVSRFEWGLVTDIQAPDLETRIAILRKKAEESRISVSDEVTFFIAEQVTANIRELEGALIRVVAYCNFSTKPQTREVAQEVLRDMVREVNSRITIPLIQHRIAEYFNVMETEMRGSSRQRSVLYPRQIGMYLCRKLTGASLPEIGRAFGGRDHTTVMHAIDKITKQIEQDPHKKQTVELAHQAVVSTSSNTG